MKNEGVDSCLSSQSIYLPEDDIRYKFMRATVENFILSENAEIFLIGIQITPTKEGFH